MDKLLSIIVPVYNAEKYLKKCIDSILNQTYSNLEVILVDDGSKDSSAFICDEYEKQDKRIKVIHKQNNGAAAARNTGLNHASGEYIAFVDSDDYIDLNMYEDMMDINKEYDCDIVMCDCYKENSTSRNIYTHDIRPGYYDKEMLYNEYFPQLLMTNSVEYPATISNCLCLFKKNLIEKHNIRYKDGMRFSEDLLLGSQAMYYANNFYYLKNKPFYHYIFNGSSVTNTYYLDKWTLMKQLHEAIEEFFLYKDDFDFRRQVDLSLLFFVYHCINNIKYSTLNKEEKTKEILNILKNKDVEAMFKRVKINSLDITWKLKIVTFIYKYKIKGLFYL